MKTIKHATFIATYAPRRCGIATFTQDLRCAVESARSGMVASVAAIARSQSESHPVEVEYVVAEDVQGNYTELREALNASNTDIVSVQHEYGIFGGPDGAWILDILHGLTKPVVTTCHTVLDFPTRGQQEVLREIGRVSTHMVVMTWKARELLVKKYGMRPESISVIPHGIPDTEPASLPRDELRRTFGFEGKEVLLTTGLLSPGKGLEHAIAGMPRILTARPNAMYVVAGATHPNLLQSEGEAYRSRLQHLAAALGIADSILFMDRFFSREELVNLIVAADVFVTPYLGEAQITSGVLAYASGLGKPVISTPYWHARELLDEGLGVIVPFASPDDLAGAAIDLLGDVARLNRMSELALERGRLTRWTQIGRDYLDLFDAKAWSGNTTAPRVRAPRPPLGTPLCSPLETNDGWLLITHSVGARRKYCIGAMLLDRDDPRRIIGRLAKSAHSAGAGRTRGLRAKRGLFLRQHHSRRNPLPALCHARLVHVIRRCARGQAACSDAFGGVKDQPKYSRVSGAEGCRWKTEATLFSCRPFVQDGFVSISRQIRPGSGFAGLA